jgi:hypothetical protein
VLSIIAYMLSKAWAWSIFVYSSRVLKLPDGGGGPRGPGDAIEGMVNMRVAL